MMRLCGITSPPAQPGATSLLGKAAPAMAHPVQRVASLCRIPCVEHIPANKEYINFLPSYLKDIQFPTPLTKWVGLPTATPIPGRYPSTGIHNSCKSRFVPRVRTLHIMMLGKYSERVPWVWQRCRRRYNNISASQQFPVVPVTLDGI